MKAAGRSRLLFAWSTFVKDQSSSDHVFKSKKSYQNILNIYINRSTI